MLFSAWMYVFRICFSHLKICHYSTYEKICLMVKFRNTRDERSDEILENPVLVQETRLDPICQAHLRSPILINRLLLSTKSPGFAFLV